MSLGSKWKKMNSRAERTVVNEHFILGFAVRAFERCLDFLLHGGRAGGV